MTRWIKIQNNQKGNAFFVKNNRRYYLSEFMKDSFFWGKQNVHIHGVLSLTNNMAMGLHLSDDGEAVKVYYF